MAGSLPFPQVSLAGVPVLRRAGVVPPSAVRRVGAPAADQVVVAGVAPEHVVASGAEQAVVDEAVPRQGVVAL